MQYTNHYNLNLPEGSDIVNPLVQDNPNYSAIDTALYDNKVRTVGNATEVKSGTVHAITRSDSDIDVMRFTATGNWDTGDTMTVDGTPVSVYLPDGTAPLTGAYVINTEVVAAISGSRVTLYGAQKLPNYDASDINYDNTGSGLTATNVQDAIDEVKDLINTEWTLLGYCDAAQGVVASASIAAIPANAKEIRVVIKHGDHNSAFFLCSEIYRASELTGATIRAAYSYTSSGAMCDYQIATNSLGANASNYSAGVSALIYYR